VLFPRLKRTNTDTTFHKNRLQEKGEKAPYFSGGMNGPTHCRFGSHRAE
jgi:hypothetical protein